MKVAIGLLMPKGEDMPQNEGLLSEPEVDTEEYPLTKESNDKMVKVLMETRHLGAKDPANPGNFWVEIADFWGMDEEEAQDRRCANCEYFDPSPMAQKAMKVVPESEFDKTGGGRGYCHKYNFICHNLRVCDQWDCEEEED